MSKNFFLSLLFFSLFSASCIAMEERIINKSDDQASNANEVDNIKLKTGVGKIRDIKCNYAGDKIVVIGQDCDFAEVWDINSETLVSRLHGHKEPILCVLWHPTKDIIFTGSKDKTIKIWNANSGQCINQILFKKSCAEKLTAITSIAYIETEFHPIILAGTDKELAIVRIKDKYKESDNRWNIGDFLSYNKPTNSSISYVTFNQEGSLAFVATRLGTLRIYIKPFNLTRDKRSWKLIFENNLGQKIESIKSNDNGDVFVQLKNKNKTGLLLNIINYNITPISDEVADYCPNTSSFLIIKNQRYICEYKGTSTKEFADQLIIEQDSNIQRAIYNSSGDRIIVITENAINIWKKINDTWLCTYKLSYFENYEDLLILNNNRPVIANVDGNIISILKPKESNPPIVNNNIESAELQTLIDLTQLDDSEGSSDKSDKSLKRKSIAIDSHQPIQPSKAQKYMPKCLAHKNTSTLDHEAEKNTEADSEEYESTEEYDSTSEDDNLEKELDYEQEHTPVTIELRSNRDIDQATILPSTEESKQISYKAQAAKKDRGISL